MGHNRKTANRAEAIRRNSRRAEANRKELSKLRERIRLLDGSSSRARLELERRLLGEIETVLGTVVELSDDFELHRRPMYRKAIDWIQFRFGSAANDFDELEDVIDLDFSEDEPDHLDGRPLNLDYEPITTGSDKRLEPDPAVLEALDPDKLEKEFEELAEGPGPEEAPTFLGAIEIDADPDNLDPTLGTPVPVTLTVADEPPDAFGSVLEQQKARLRDPERILRRLELRLESEKGIAADVMENQDLDEEEKNRLMDQSMERIEDFEGRIAHQKLIICGFKSKDATKYLAERPPLDQADDDRPSDG